MSERIWSDLLIGQLDFYVEVSLFPRLEGLTDEEYLWAPVQPSWSVRPSPSGGFEVDPRDREDGPFTTIAWRVTHLAVDNLGTRAACFFGPERFDGADMFDERYAPPVPGTAAEAVDLLHTSYDRWRAGVGALDDAQMAAALGPAGGPFADDSFGALVMHVNRETMHHGGEIGVLRDLYRDRATLSAG